MKSILNKFIALAILIIALQITLMAQPIGSKIKIDTSGLISYWNNVDAWIPIVPGLPGQTLKFTAGIPLWINNPNGITTTTVSNITGTTALSGGNILSDGGAKIIARGVCWSSSPNPTIIDNKCNDGKGIGSYTSNITGLNPGTTYYIRSYATNSNGTAYGNEVIISISYKVYDIDGNAYDTVQIGNQIWMKQNLNTSRYNNGTAIPNISDNATWNGLITGARCYYNNDSASNASTYGALYNWYTVNTGNLCPIGWHIPTDAEWTLLTNYLGGLNIAGGKLKATTLWSLPNTGATNESGFTAIPSGYRYDFGVDVFNSINYDCSWWSLSEYDINGAWARSLDFLDNSMLRYHGGKKYGLSIRCIKD